MYANAQNALRRMEKVTIITMLGAKTSVTYASIRGGNVSAAHRSLSASHDQEKHMNRFGSLLKPLMWFMALLLATLVAGCGGGGGGGGGGTAPGPTVCTGAACVSLGTASNFVILAEDAITDANVPSSAVTGDVGLTPASGTFIGLTCAEVTGGVIYTVDPAGPPCRVPDAARLTAAKNDGIAAFFDAKGRAPDFVGLGAGNIGGRNLGPATYKWNTAVVIPTNLTLTGGPNDVWIFQIAPQNLSVSSGVQVILAGGALPQNIFWETNFADLGANSQFKGVILADNAVVMRTGASIIGRVLAGSVANLDRNTVTQPGP